MPRIRQYSTEVSVQAPIGGRPAKLSDIDQGGFAFLGAGASDLANQLETYQGRAEVADVQTQLAKKRAEWTLKLRQRAEETPASGYASFAQKFSEEFSADIQSIGENLSTRHGREAFQVRSGQLSADFMEKAGLEQARLAGNKVTQDYLATLDANRNTLLNDPSQFQSILNEITASLNDQNGPYSIVPADKRAELERMTRTDLAKSAVQGMIRVNPHAALEQLRGGKFKDLLDADVTAQLDGTARQAINAERIEAERLKKLEEDRIKKEQQATGNDFLARMYEGSLSAKDIINSNLNPTGENSKATYLRMLEQKLKPEAAVKGGPAFRSLYERLYLPDDDPMKIRRESELDAAYLNPNTPMAFEDLTRLRTEFQNIRGPEGVRLKDEKQRLFDEVKTSITKSNPLQGKLDQSGDLQYGAFMDFVDREIQSRRDKGESLFSLFDSRSKDYLGSPQVLARFQTPIQQSIENITGGIRRRPMGGVGKPQVEQRRPGETIDEYRNRVAK